MMRRLETADKLGDRDVLDVELNKLTLYSIGEVRDPIERDVVFARKETLEFRPAKQGWLMRLLHRTFGWEQPIAA